MSRYYSYLNKAVSLLELYKGEEPFSLFLKDQFAKDKRMGSTDRRLVRHYCYCYFRTGMSFKNAPTAEKLLAGVWLTSTTSDPLLEAIRPAWNETIHLSTEEKLKQLQIAIDDIFPWQEELSDNLSTSGWPCSLLVQPAAFIRIRPGKERQVVDRIMSSDIACQLLSSSSISFPPSTQLQKLAGLNRDYVIQDYSSQQVASLFSLAKLPPKPFVWDCCAASGGKSILAIDTLGEISLLASDVRVSMLSQLKKRFKEAEVDAFDSRVIDLEKGYASIPENSVDLLIADVPCSGSGTWGRTPEQLCFFQSTQIESYAVRQQKIVANALPSLRKGGYLLYITCSVFRKENENNIELLTRQNKMKLIQASIFNGSQHRADTLFAALLQKI